MGDGYGKGPHRIIYMTGWTDYTLENGIQAVPRNSRNVPFMDDPSDRRVLLRRTENNAFLSLSQNPENWIIRVYGDSAVSDQGLMIGDGLVRCQDTTCINCVLVLSSICSPIVVITFSPECHQGNLSRYFPLQQNVFMAKIEIVPG